MPRPRLDEDQLAAILDIAGEVIAKRRADGTRLVDIARASGVSVGTLQHYFGSREELLAATFARANAVAAQHCAELAQPGDDVHARLRGLVDGLVDEPVSWLLWTEYWALGARAPQMREMTAQHYALWHEIAASVLEQGVAEGVFHPRLPAAEFGPRLTAVADGVGIQMLLGLLTPEEARTIVTDIAERELGSTSRSS